MFDSWFSEDRDNKFARSWSLLSREMDMDLSLLGQSRWAVGRHRAALSGLGPWSALRSRPRVALSSAQVSSVYLGALRLCKSLLLGLGTSPGVGRRQFLLACGPDRLGPTGQLVGWRDLDSSTH